MPNANFSPNKTNMTPEILLIKTNKDGLMYGLILEAPKEIPNSTKKILHKLAEKNTTLSTKT